MSPYMTASEGWRFPPSGRELLKEPAGTRHAVAGSAHRTLCDLPVAAALTCFPNIGFMAGRPADRCPECGRAATFAPSQ